MASPSSYSSRPATRTPNVCPPLGDVSALYASHKALSDLKCRIKILEEENKKLVAQNKTLLQTLRLAKINPDKNTEKIAMENKVKGGEDEPTDLELEQLLHYCMSQMTSLQQVVDKQNKKMKTILNLISIQPSGSAAISTASFNDPQTFMKHPLSEPSTILAAERNIQPMQCSDGFDPQYLRRIQDEFQNSPNEITFKSSSDPILNRRKSEVLRPLVTREAAPRRVISSHGSSSTEFAVNHCSELNGQNEERRCPICNGSFPDSISQDIFEEHVNTHLDSIEHNIEIIPFSPDSGFN